MTTMIRLIALAVLITGGCMISASKSETYIRARVVKLSSSNIMCTGEQIKTRSGANYILTAGHCRPIMDADGNFMITTEDGKHLKRKLIAEDPDSDLLLLEGIPNVEGLEIADSYKLPQSVRTFTHGSNLDTHKTEGELIQLKEIPIPVGAMEDPAIAKICEAKGKYKVLNINSLFGSLSLCVIQVEELITTAKITPGSSGGPVVDKDGSLVGVVSATDETFGYLVPLKQIKAFVDNY